MKPSTVIPPFLLPRLSDTAAAQLVAALHTLVTVIEQHYAAQIQRLHRRNDHRRYGVPTARPDDPF